MRSAVAGPPPTMAEPVVDVLHGIEVTDPYRWLEDQDAPRTRSWIEEQTAYTHSYFKEISGRQCIRDRVEQFLALKGSLSEPWNVGNRFFFLKRREKDEQPVIVMRDSLFGEDQVLIDPALRGTGPQTAVSILAISNDGRFLAYAMREGGTDHAALEILDLRDNVVLPDRLPDGFLNGFVFAPDNSGFFYSHRNLHDARPNYRVAYWHAFGNDRSQDKEVFFAGEQANLFLSILCSPEAKRLAYVVFRTGKRRSTSMYLQDFSDQAGSAKPLLEDIEGCFVPFFVRDQLFAYTDLLAPINHHLVRASGTMSCPKPTGEFSSSQLRAIMSL